MFSPFCSQSYKHEGNSLWDLPSLRQRQDSSASQVHHRLSGMWAHEENNSYLPKHKLEKHHFRLEMHPVSFSLPKHTASSGWIIYWWHSPRIAFKYSWFLKVKRCNDNQVWDRLKNPSSQKNCMCCFSYQLHSPSEVNFPREIISTSSL